MNILNDIDDMLWQLRDGASLPQLRSGVADLIRRTVALRQATPTYWVKLHIAEACGDFYQNVRLGLSTMWLRHCLLSLRDAFLPLGTYDEDYGPRNVRIDKMTYRELSRAVDEVLLESVVIAT